MLIMNLQIQQWDKKIAKLKKKSDIAGLARLQRIIEATSGVDESIKTEYIEKCEEAKNNVEYKKIDSPDIETNDIEVNDDIEITEENINAEDVTVGEDTRHVKMSKKQVAAIVIGAAAVAVIAGVTIDSCNGCAKNTSLEEETTSGNDEEKDDETITNPNTIKPTLVFDTENTEVMIENLKGFVKDILPSGIELTDAELEEEVESLVNYYVWLNLNEIGPSYLSELYQTDSISYIEVFSDAMYWANALRFDSITSSVKGNTIVDLSSMISNKKDLELVQNFQELNARLHDAVDANDVANIKGIVSEYRTLVETKLLDHKSYSYGQGAMDLCFRLVYSGEQLLADYDMVIMDESLAKIINEDEFLKCIQSITINTIEDKEYTKEELEQTIQTNTSKKSDNVIYQIDLLKDYMLRLNMQLDFTGKKSVADVMVEVPAYIRENNLLSTYKENESLEVFFARIYEQTHAKVETVKPEDVVIDNDKYIEKEELDKHGIVTDNKTPQQVEKEYQEAVKEEVENKLENDKTFTDNKGNVSTGSDADKAKEEAVQSWSAYYQGEKDGLMGNPCNVPSKYADKYKEGYAAGVKQRQELDKEAEKETTVVVTPVDPKEETTEVIDEGKVDDTITVYPIVPPNDNLITVNPIIRPAEEETTSSTIIEEEVIEEGLLTPKAEEVTTGYDELYYLYYEYLLALKNYSDEELSDSKTR